PLSLPLLSSPPQVLLPTPLLLSYPGSPAHSSPPLLLRFSCPLLSSSLTQVLLPTPLLLSYPGSPPHSSGSPAHSSPPLFPRFSCPLFRFSCLLLSSSPPQVLLRS